jgi:two-component system cell cycle sensor histidine kinase/response regulator CckA
MNASTSRLEHAHDLRQRAEKLVRLTRRDVAALPVENVQSLVHELQVYQIQLDMQNEQLRKTQQELEESRDQYSDLYDFAPVGYLTLDPQGFIQEANLTAATLIGVARSNLTGTGFRRLVAAGDLDRFRSHLKAVFAAEARCACELELVRKDGTSFCARLEGIRALSGSGQTLSCRMAISDITARKHAELERQQLEAKVREAQKLESLGVLAGGIAHDFNNLLTGILGFASLAQVQIPPDAPAQDGLRHVVRAAERAAELVRQMLAYAGKGKSAVLPVDLSGLANEMLALLRTSLSKKAELKLDLPAGLPTIEADAAQVRQVFMNLLTNASEALADQEGVITIRTGVIEADQAYLAQTCLHDNPPEGTYLFVEVADTGCGMTEDTVSRIFEPFFTTKFTGRGLGLAAVLGIVRGRHEARRRRLGDLLPLRRRAERSRADGRGCRQKRISEKPGRGA